jgi:hypothetical protein
MIRYMKNELCKINCGMKMWGTACAESAAMMPAPSIALQRRR